MACSRVFYILAMLLIFSLATNAQVTFSRDWNAGKRAIDGVPNAKEWIQKMCNVLDKSFRFTFHNGVNEDIEGAPILISPRV